MCLFHKILSWTTNSVDPDQTAGGAVCSGSELFASAISSEMLVYEILGYYHIYKVLHVLKNMLWTLINKKHCMQVAI